MTEFINAPENYEEVLYWKITQRPMLIAMLNLAGIPLLLLAGMVFFNWARLWHSQWSTDFGGLETISLLFGIVLILVLHELAHGLTMKRFGARPKYGILWEGMMFYATAPGYAFRRNSYLIIALAPLVGLSILCAILLMLPMSTGFVIAIIACATFNAAGAVGDMWITRTVLRYPAYAYIVDEKDGVRVLMPAGEA